MDKTKIDNFIKIQNMKNNAGQIKIEKCVLCGKKSLLFVILTVFRK